MLDAKNISLLQLVNNISEVRNSPEESSRLSRPLLHLGGRDVDLKRISQFAQVSFHYVDALLDLVVLLHVPPVLLGLLVEEHQPLPVGGVRVEILLAGQEEIGVAENIKYF